MTQAAAAAAAAAEGGAGGRSGLVTLLKARVAAARGQLEDAKKGAEQAASEGASEVS